MGTKDTRAIGLPEPVEAPKAKKKPRSLDERIADLQARKERDAKRIHTVDALESALRAVRVNDFTGALHHSLRATEILTPADATKPLIEERAAE
jgi:hypothetical protein